MDLALKNLRYAARAVAVGSVRSLELVEASLQRYRDTEPQIHAFAWLDEERARRTAAERDRESSRGPLHGVPVAVKDIFDTAGIPTEHGSRLFAGRVPRRSAAVVRALERAGAVIIGKTVTAELAYYSPGPTRNPHDLSRSPGGSSQGSAAAVAAGVLPGAVGSQTNGSTIRPAAYCGVVGFKPTVGRISMRGALEFSHTLDHVGVFTTRVEDAGLLAAALAGDPIECWAGETLGRPHLAAVPTSDWNFVGAAMRERFLACVGVLAAAGARIAWPLLPAALDDAARLVGVLMAYEAARSIGPVAMNHPGLVSGRALALFERGREMLPADYHDALRDRRRLIAAFRRWITPYDALLTPPATGEAPDYGTTGDPLFCSRWSLIGAPAISIPSGVGPTGLPLGLQLVGAKANDRQLLAAARWVQDRLDGAL